jgi:hypothetical protein
MWVVINHIRSGIQWAKLGDDLICSIGNGVFSKENEIIHVEVVSSRFLPLFPLLCRLSQSGAHILQYLELKTQDNKDTYLLQILPGQIRSWGTWRFG